MPETTGVVVIGGGICGLAAARELAKRQVPYQLLEASDRWGGVIRTEIVDGFLMDAGPDAMLAQKPEGTALAKEVGLGDRLVPTNPHQRSVFVLHRGRLVALPEGMMLAVPTRFAPMVKTPLFSWPAKLRMGLDLVLPRRRATSDESIASLLRRRFGQQAVDRLGEPLMAGIHAGDPERLSIQATFPRFTELERRHGSLIRGMFASRPKSVPAGPPPAAFYSLVGGLGEMVAALVARLGPSALRTQARVAAIERASSGVTVRLEGGDVIQARAVVLAVPPRVASALLRPLVSSVADDLASIPFASSAVVFLGYRREDVAHPLDGYGFVVPRGEGLRMAAGSFVSTKFPGRAAEGRVLLRAFLGGVRDPGILDLDDAAIVETARREMGGIVGLRGDPLLTRVFRWPSATPQMEVGHLDLVARVEGAMAAVPEVVLSGAGLRVTGLPDGIADGTRAAAAAAAVVTGGAGPIARANSAQTSELAPTPTAQRG